MELQTSYVISGALWIRKGTACMIILSDVLDLRIGVIAS